MEIWGILCGWEGSEEGETSGESSAPLRQREGQENIHELIQVESGKIKILTDEGQGHKDGRWIPGKKCSVNKPQRQETDSQNLKGWKMGTRA